MKILVIDGQGGAIGSQMIKMLKEEIPKAEIIAVGTNAIATGNMLKAGCTQAATGENAVIVQSRSADVIVGPIGIVVADALLGEVSPAMAVAVGQSSATKVLIPLNKCETLIAGISNVATTKLLSDAVSKVKNVLNISEAAI